MIIIIIIIINKIKQSKIYRTDNLNFNSEIKIKYKKIL